MASIHRKVSFQHHWPSGKYKLRSPRDSVTYLQKELTDKRKAILSFTENVANCNLPVFKFTSNGILFQKQCLFFFISILLFSHSIFCLILSFSVLEFPCGFFIALVSLLIFLIFSFISRLVDLLKTKL